MENDLIPQPSVMTHTDVLEWCIGHRITSIEIARIYEPKKVGMYETDLQYLQTELAKERLNTIQSSHRQSF